MARPDDALSCPSCGARNKARWEYCVRCGESLKAAQLVSGSTITKSKAPAIEVHAADQVSPWNGVLATVFLLLFLGTALAAVRFARNEGPAPIPDPAAFTFPTQPPAVRDPPEPAPVEPGRQAFDQGRRLRAEGDAAGAAILLAQAVGDNPENPLFQWTYGEALVASGVRESGLAAMGEAVRLDPSYRLEYVKSLENAGWFAQAAAESEVLLGEQPDRADALVAAGRAFSAQNNHARAVSVLERAVELQPQNADASDALGRAAFQSGDFQKAALAFGEIVSRDPGNNNAREALTSSLVRQGDMEQALATVRRGIQIDPSSPELRRRLGQVLEGAGRPTEAAAAYREYARLAPRASDAAGLVARAAQLSGTSGS